MSDLKEILDANKNGALNAYSYERFSSLNVSDSTEGNYADTVRAAIQKVFSDSTEYKEDGPYHAVCLAAFENPAGEIPGEVKAEGSLIQVIARIPKKHQSIPKPVRSGLQGLPCESLVKAAILMHPVFYAMAGGDIGPLPKPGNIVKVDFHSENNTKYGTYLGLADDGSEATPGSEEGAADAFAEDVPVSTLEDSNGG